VTYKSLADQLYSNIEVDDKTNCWNWTKYKNKKGYGTVKINKTMQLAHRMSYKQATGSLLDKKHVLHRCDNPSCINPDHLWEGDNLDNVIDKVNKGRQGSKLTKQDAIDIKNSTKTTAELQQLYPVTAGHIRLIKTNKTWKSV
jgi:HNH endonuclease